MMICLRQKFLLLFTVLCLTLPPNAISSVIPPEDFKDSVSFIFIEGKDGKVANGTGFFVGVVKDKTLYGYLVTAKHVLQTERKQWYSQVWVRLNTKDSKSDMIPLTLVDRGPNRNVFTHLDSSVDIAVIPFLPDQEKYRFRVIPEKFIPTEDTARSFKEGMDIFFIGLFSHYYGTLKNYPVYRFGRLSLITEEKIKFIENQEAYLYLAETSSYGGNSGSPVFFYQSSDQEPGTLMAYRDPFMLGGIMRGTYLDLQEIRAVETATSYASASNMGIAAIVPSYKLLEILYGADLRRLRH